MTKNKYIFFVLMFVFAFSLCSGAEASEYKNEVSVGISYGAENKGPFTVSSSGVINVTDYVSGETLYTTTPSEILSVEMGSTGFAAWEKFDASGRSKLLFRPANSGNITCNGTEYRGYIFASAFPWAYRSLSIDTHPLLLANQPAYSTEKQRRISS